MARIHFFVLLKFTDIEGHWGEKYINMAAEKGLIKGYPDSTFHPDEPITRAEAMAIINRLLNRHPDKDFLPKGMIMWPDNMDTEAWYYADVQEATNSHEYEMVGTHEWWTKLLPVRDWAAFEKEWSTSHSASNPGDVVGNDLEIDLSKYAPTDGQNTDKPVDEEPVDEEPDDNEEPGDNEPGDNEPGDNEPGDNEPGDDNGNNDNGNDNDLPPDDDDEPIDDGDNERN